MKTFVIAEAGINHGGDVIVAMQLVDAAQLSGCSAIKFQTYITEKRTTAGSPIYDILKQCELSYHDQQKVKEYADSVGIEFFSTPFDEKSLDFLIKIGVKTIKIASFDLTNSNLLDKLNSYGIADKELRVIMSTGMANEEEILKAVERLKNVELAVLHCVSSYPTPNDKVNLNAIKTLRNILPEHIEVGYSDHTDSIIAPAAAVLCGATVIEKHFTLDHSNGAVDNPVSADPVMMQTMIHCIENNESMMGHGQLCLDNIERDCLQYRRVT